MVAEDSKNGSGKRVVRLPLPPLTTYRHKNRGEYPMDSSFSTRIEADIRRARIVSVDEEERVQLERWLEVGVPTAEELAARFTNAG